ncbi:MAG: thioredoxin domain-containing protein [Syntrophomonadaceae bacterium]
MSESKVANRLLQQKSPYLLQHAYNPVNWYPWGDEAFAKAKAEDKPIFLSIGYSTCHWCHVMERESFEDTEIADLLNRDFIAIKVDREERPDIDHIYMMVCQVMTGHGGWPLTIIMTPDKQPFFTATYIPKHSRYGLSGLVELLPRIIHLWKNERAAVLDSSQKVTAWLNQPEKCRSEVISREVFDRAFEQYVQSFDNEFGGFGNAPKFPTPQNLYFLLRYHYYTGNAKALHMVEKTLQQMYQGGIYDHIGFGFSRYSTDNKWLVPHFEKMLYDNALLAIAWLETYQVTGNHFYRRVAEEIFNYVLSNMTSPEGGFYSAEDADSEGVEGKFYVWTPEQIKKILPDDEADEFCQVYDITVAGNFEGKSIPNLIKRAIDEQEHAKFAEARQQLYNQRQQRIAPYKDDKILLAWNGLMIAALAFGYRVLKKTEYSKAFRAAINFARDKMCREDGRLMARYRDSEAAWLAYSADYSFFIRGLLESYQATYETEFLQLAIKFSDEQIKYFWDNENGGMYFYGSDAESLLTRPKEFYDSALPSDNSVALANLFQLAAITGEDKWEQYAHKLKDSMSSRAAISPLSHAYFLSSVLSREGGGREIIITGEENDPLTDEMLGFVQKLFLPDTVTIFCSDNDSELNHLIPRLQEMITQPDKTTAYVCQNFTCEIPITTLLDLEIVLKQSSE